MLTLPPFEWSEPTSLDQALGLLSEKPGEALVVAGGTDAVPNLKHRLHEPRRVVHIGRLRELAFIEVRDDGLHLGPLVTLSQLERHPAVRRDAPSLAKAAGLVAGPQLRAMGTVGGNLCLDTRCTYYNQTYACARPAASASRRMVCTATWCHKAGAVWRPTRRMSRRR